MLEESIRGVAADEYPLSNSQSNIWNLEQTYQGTSINVISETIRIRGTFDIALVQKCLNLIMQADGSLRTQITLVNRVPMQQEMPFSEQQYPVFDFTATDETGIRHWEQAVTHEPMSVLNEPLCRFSILKMGEHEGGILIKTHHMISDGWSQVLLINRIADTYLALVSGREVKLEVAPSYRLHVEDEAKYDQSGAYHRDEAYWAERMSIDAQPASLKDCPGATVSPIGQRKSYEFPQMLSQAVFAFCNQYRVAPFAVFYMALAIYLKRIGGSDKFRIGVPIYNRINAVDRDTSGMFVSTLPFVGMVDENWSLVDFVENLTEDWYDMLRHQRYPLSRIANLMNKSGAKAHTDTLLQMALSFQNSRLYCNQNAAILFSGQWHYSGYQAERLCIHLSNMESDRRYTVSYDYLTQLFSEEEIENFHNYLMTILSEALASQHKPIWQLPVLNHTEQEKVLFSFNNTDILRPKGTIADRLQFVMQKNPERVAVIKNGERTTYQALLAHANDMAHALADGLTKTQEVVGILLPRSADLLAAMAGIAQAGHAWILLSEQWPKKRIEEILTDSGAKALITTKANLQNLSLTDDVAVIDVNALTHRDTRCMPMQPEPGDLAYVVYTSGSTGKPKGAEIEQRSLLNFCSAIEQLYGHDGVLSVCNISFDAFLVDSIGALLHGRTIVLPEEEDIENPGKLAKLIRRYAVDFLSMTPSHLAAYCKDQSFLSALCRIESIICGGEHFPRELLMLLKRHTKARIYNQYGPSETTIGVSYCLLNDASRISIGRPMPGCRFYVLDEHLQPLPIGIYGDLFISGLCVGRGYRNAPELTAKAFTDNPFEYGERMYRTGDVACWTAEGEIVLRGRKDDQMKLRGLRIEPQEVAARLAMHEDIDRAFVRIYEKDGQQALVAFYTSNRFIAEHELLSFAATYLPAYMIPSYFQRLETVPVTANGKIDYARLPGPVLAPQETAMETPKQKRIVEIFANVLGCKELTASSDYFRFGGNSLNALETLAAIEEAFGQRLRAADLWACRTAARLEKLIVDKGTQVQPIASIEPAPKLRDYPLTSTQQSIYVQAAMDTTQLAYNMPGALRFNSRPDGERLHAALKELVAAHAVLRVSFHMKDSGLCQVIEDNVPFEMETLQAEDLHSALHAFVRPFDLGQAPLMRAALWHEDQDTDVLFIDMHHIIGDGMSTPILLKQLNALYRGERPHLPAVNFVDYAYWSQMQQTELPPSLRDYWKEALSGLTGTLDLPLDYPRPKQFDFKGDKVFAALPIEKQKQVEEYCLQRDITPYMLFMAAFGILLSKASGSEDFVVGTPVAGRPRSEWMQVIGSFIQTLPLRLCPKADMKLTEYLKQVKSSVLGLLDHQQMPLEQIIAMSGAPRELGHHTLYNTMLTMRPMTQDAFQFDGQSAQVIPIPTNTSKLDISLEIFMQQSGAFGFAFEYATSLYQRQTIEFLSRSFVAIVKDILRDDSLSVAQTSALDAWDRVRLWEHPNHLHTPFVNLPLDRQIEQTAQMMPDEPAMVFHGQTVTFDALMRRARHIEGRLAANGTKKGDVIGFALSRGVDLVAAMIGIMQMGCTYMPMLASFPHNRLRTMAEIANTSLVLCDATTKNLLPVDWPCRLVTIEGETAPFITPSDRCGDELMHVLFTSGSTGKPKGVMLHHRAISNLHGALAPLFEKTPGRVLCTTNAVFDTFIAETLLPLCHGRCIVMADEEEMMLPWRMAELIEKENARIMQLTPSRLLMCLGNNAFAAAVSHLSMMLLAGEALSLQLKEKLRSTGDMAIINLYGPTEAAVYATMADVTERADMVIGKPLANCRAYVLNEQGDAVIPTARGELHLAGECLAKGYIGQDELTKQAFLPDPWFPGEKMYRTGDIVRLLPDGNFAFIGRRDSQVKLNGQRVELDEITNRVIASHLANEAATIAYRVDENSPMKLRLYAVAREQQTSEADIRAYLKKELPNYMIPSDIVFVPALPRAATGKTDLRALQSEAMAQSVSKQAKEQTDTTMAPLPIEQEAFDASWALQEEKPLCEAGQTGKEEGDFADNSPAVPASLAKLPIQQSKIQTDLPRIQPIMKKSDEPAFSHEQKNGIFEPDYRQRAFIQNDLLPLWEQVLSCKTLDEGLSFFEQGGTSLGALHLLSLYFNKNYTMTLEQFYENPTIQAQARLLCGTDPAFRQVQSGAAQRAEIALSERERDTKAETAVWPRLAKAAMRDAVLLTGATGFLGAHLVRELLDAGTPNVVCTVRQGNAARLWDTLTWYFGRDWFKRNYHRVTAVSGDVRLPMIGIDCAFHANTLARVGCILHAAADIRHHAKDDGHFKTNYEGTKHVIELSQTWSMPLCHVSTISVSGETIVNEPDKIVSYTETDRDIGQNWRDNIYVKTKFMAEKLVFAAMASGLEAKIFRVGRLVGRSSDGVFQRNPEGNAFRDFVMALRHLEQIPASFADMPIEMTPVDECARAIVKLLAGDQPVYHVINPYPLTLRTLAQELGYTLQEVDDKTFERHLMTKMNITDYRELAPLVDIYNRNVNQRVTIFPDCKMTVKELAKRQFTWCKPDVKMQLTGFANANDQHRKGGD